jgi:hypothetical protein
MIGRATPCLYGHARRIANARSKKPN